jgi:carboxyl-terminal processing protease
MKKYLQHISKNLFLATFSIVLVLGIFGIGFFIGNKSENNPSTSLNAQTPADLEAFWTVWNLIDEKYVPASSTVEVTDEFRIQGAIQGMVDSLGDPYSRFLIPEEHKDFNESISGNFSGVGMEVGKKDSVITVISPLKDTPAEKAGIKAGDIILKIDGNVTADMSVDEAVNLIRGEKGTIVEFIIARMGEEGSMSIKVVRDNIKIPTLEYEMRKDGIFVISLFNFSAGVDNDFRKALREFVLSKSDKLILDLRGNPGGYLDSAVDISSWFLPAGKIVVQEDFGKNGSPKIFRSKGYNIFNDNLKMVVLVNGGSASASEIVAGALKEHGVAKILGEKTYGKGSVQELIPISDDTSLKLTIARWLTPNGVSISDSGLEPDIVVEALEDDPDTDDEADVQLEEAVKLILKKR